MRKTKATTPQLEHAIGYEYEALPLSIQRKFFSSHEKLILEKRAVADQTCELASGSSSRAGTGSSIPASALALAPFRHLHSRRRACTVDIQPQEPQFTQAEAAFFLSLPDKVRKQLYSREEQVVILAKAEQALDEAAAIEQRLHEFSFPWSTTNNPETTTKAERRRSSFSTFSPRRPSFGFYPKSKKERDAESSVFFLDTMDSPSIRKSRPAGCRRTMSLGGPPSRHSTCSAATGPTSPLFVFPAEYQSQHQRSQSSAIPVRRSSLTPQVPTFDPEAKYYQDPETRTKLRTYLSPQKFDEAIEFGFPSTAEHDTPMPHYQLPPVAKHSRKFSRDMHTFLRDGKLSFIEDKQSENQGLESDSESVADLDSPRTPSSTGLSFRLHTRQMSSIDSNGLPASQPSPGLMNREMTLRMTLTRPELRADEDALYGWQNKPQHQHHQSQNSFLHQSPEQHQHQPLHQHTKSTPTASIQDDPLALEELVFTDDHTGTKGAFYVKPKPRGNLVTRIFKRASLKGRSHAT
ncbi:hypothetical protein E8E13_009616 [Curvularia kusanoi]|uniref:Uncharacterized protein n=1 Tax=Curvularia kusanoi TaxID=90978 RepID=A0A9P4WAR2_CURKU|nr:hypothetical protein E8E13_009616 [Curvularia kusanoi]